MASKGRPSPFSLPMWRLAGRWGWWQPSAGGRLCNGRTLSGSRTAEAAVVLVAAAVGQLAIVRPCPAMLPQQRSRRLATWTQQGTGSKALTWCDVEEERLVIFGGFIQELESLGSQHICQHASEPARAGAHRTMNSVSAARAPPVLQASTALPPLVQPCQAAQPRAAVRQ